ncbi:MAG: hypothetical protein MRZ50_07080 [Prevotella sp.]|nr:hypothetical protein [Prevotella sp.]
MQQSTYKKRSINACITEGYKLYKLNLGNIIKATWKENAVTSIACAILLVALTRFNSPLNYIIGGIAAIAFLICLAIYEKKIIKIKGEGAPYHWHKKLLFSNFGSFFSMVLLTSIINITIFALICIPLIIMLLASHLNQIGIEYGDTDGIPGYFNILLFFVCGISAFVILHIQVWQTFTACYLYESAEAKNESAEAGNN